MQPGPARRDGRVDTWTLHARATTRRSTTASTQAAATPVDEAPAAG